MMDIGLRPHAELAALVVNGASYMPPTDLGPIPGWADPVYLFACGKTHIRESGTACPCGREFPYPHRREVCR